MDRYGIIAKGSFMARIVWRSSIIFTFIGNFLYIILLYYLWKAIYQGTESINGVSFDQTFVYLAVASCLFTIFQVSTEWLMSDEILRGDIIIKVVKPIDYQFHKLFEALGSVLCNFITILVPTLLAVIFIFNTPINLGTNLILFLISVFWAMFISFFIDYMIGLIAFFTESIWGISIAKNVIVLLLSGAIVPLYFFPEGLQSIIHYMPFQAIFNIPLLILTDPSLNVGQISGFMCIQVVWIGVLFVLSRLFHNKATQAITINGG